jgi:integrase
VVGLPRQIAATGRGLVAQYSLDTFRHSWCTRAPERGVDAVAVAALMGHRDTTMISRVYAHLMQRRDHLRDAVRRAAGV